MAKAVVESQAFLTDWAKSFEGQGKKEYVGRISLTSYYSMKCLL